MPHGSYAECPHCGLVAHGEDYMFGYSEDELNDALN